MPLPPQLVQDLNQLLSLRDGWCDGRGRHISPGTTANIQRVFEHIGAAVPAYEPPDVTPDEDGAVDVFWPGRGIWLLFAPDGLVSVTRTSGSRLCASFRLPRDAQDCAQFVAPLLCNTK